MTSIEEGQEHLLHTTGGRTIRAKSLVLATNAFASRDWDFSETRLCPSMNM